MPGIITPRSAIRRNGLGTVLFLKQPFIIRTSLGDPDGAEKEAVFRRGYAALAQSLCGDNWDRTCQNPSRLFFCPAFRAGDPEAARLATNGFVPGNPIDFDALVLGLPPASERRPRARKAVASPERKAFDAVWAAVCWHFNAPEFFGVYKSTTKRDCQDKCQFFCPFDDDHGHPDGEGSGKTPVVAYSPEAAMHDRATVACQHDACADRTAGDFIYAVFSRENLELDDLRQFLSEEGVTAFEATINGLEPTASEIEEALDELELADQGAKADLAYNLVKRLAKISPGVDRARAIDKLSSVWGKSTKNVERLVNQESKRFRELMSHSDEEEESPREVYPNLDFAAAADRAIQLFEEGNARAQRVFYNPFLTGYGRIEPAQEGTSIEPMSSDAKWVHEIRQHVDCMHRTRAVGKYSIAPAGALISAVRGNSSLRVPVCKTIVRVPLFARDGTLHTEKGYDLSSQTFLDPWGRFLAVPDVVSDDDIDRAVTILELALRDFPFSDVFIGVDPEPVRITGRVDEEGFPLPNYERGISSRVHAMALLITPIVRELIDGPTPLYLIDKPKPGTGAGYLLNLLSYVAMGRKVSVATLGKTNEEIGKQVTAKLRSGNPLLVFDNINQYVDSDDLAAAITGGYWQGRILGKSEDTEVPIRATWAFSCNTGSLNSDLMRRTVPIRMDAATDDPTRDRPPEYFKLHSLGYTYTGWLDAHKFDLVWAIHVLVKRWLRCRQEGYVYRGPVLASFDEYSKVVGGVLDCCSIEGFLNNTIAYRETRNDESDANKLALQELYGRFKAGGGTFTASEALIALADPIDSSGTRLKFDILPPERADRIRSQGGLGTALGHWLKGMVNQGVHRLPGGLQVSIRRKDVSGIRRYTIASV